MHDTQAKWRVPPARTGPLDAAEDPAWLRQTLDWVVWGCGGLAGFTLLIALLTWAFGA